MNTTAYLSETAHLHTTRCWWNHLQAGWVCPAARTPEPDPPQVDARTVLHREVRAVAAV